MAAPDGAVALDAKFEQIDSLWSPHIVAEFNGFHVKLARIEGEFQWHTHDDTDEVFLVHRGTLTIDLEGRQPVALGTGQMFVVPAGVEHRPRAEPGTEILLIEPANTPNTGDPETAAEEPWL